jgi:hypothetical protein
MEKIFQILAVFALLMLVITYSVYARERKFREYYFSRRISLPFPGDPVWDSLSAAIAAGGEAGDPSIIKPEAGIQVIDRENQLIFHSAEGPAIIVSDQTTGRTIASIPLDENCDNLAFDPATRLIYSFSEEGVVTIIRQVSREVYKIMQRLLVSKGCHTLVLDPATGKIYLPAEGSVWVYTNE